MEYYIFDILETTEYYICSQKQIIQATAERSYILNLFLDVNEGCCLIFLSSYDYSMILDMSACSKWNIGNKDK